MQRWRGYIHWPMKPIVSTGQRNIYCPLTNKTYHVHWLTNETYRFHWTSKPIMSTDQWNLQCPLTSDFYDSNVWWWSCLTVLHVHDRTNRTTLQSEMVRNTLNIHHPRALIAMNPSTAYHVVVANQTSQGSLKRCLQSIYDYCAYGCLHAPTLPKKDDPSKMVSA